MEREFRREAAVYLAGFVGAALLQFLAVPVYTRYLGPEGYSYLALTLALTTSISGLMVIGGDAALSRFWFEAGALQERRDLALTWIVFLTAWSILVAAIAAILLAGPLASSLRPGSQLGVMLVVGLVALVPAQLSRMLAQILRNNFRATAFALTTVGVAALSVAIGVVAALVLDLGVVGILLGTVAAESLGAAMRLPLVWGDLSGRFRIRALSGPLRFGIPLVPASLAAWVFTGADKIAVGRYLSDDDLGEYAVAAMLVLPFTVLITALGQAWLPRVVEAFELDPSRARAAAGATLGKSLALFGAAAVVVALLAEPLVVIIAGPDYAHGALAVPLLALASAFFGTALFAGTGHTLAKRTAMVPVITVVAGLAQLLLLPVLVPLWGQLGAAASVACASLVLASGLLGYSQTCMPIPFNPSKLGIASVALILQAIVHSTSPQSGPSLASSVACLAVLAWSVWPTPTRNSLGEWSEVT